MLPRILAGLAAVLCFGSTVLPWVSMPGLGDFGFRDLGASQRALAAASAGVAAIFYLLGWRRMGFASLCLFALVALVSLAQTAMMLREMAPMFPPGATAGAEPLWRKILHASQFRSGAILALAGLSIWVFTFFYGPRASPAIVKPTQ